ncbi:glycosyltransferase [Nocardioides sp. zg-ZUI104]|uniref:glycosyltransferase family 2 protein n=1 Tax=Nocardioides faecalis TaxID=2803858 RepID=UPI001BCCE5FD|nr:glycosyltransferase [Nocardioides faecalis]MBS4752993.1 glycosyltransferase [Nocardioides faecalis]
MVPAGEVDVSVCVCTFRRPVELRALLLALGEQDYGGASVEVVVVDNDPAASGMPVVEEMAGLLRVPVRALHTGPPNVSAARNAAFAAARGRRLLLIDDDELPEPGWARALLDAQERYGTEAVLGPVLARHEPGAPAWIRAGEARWWGRARHATGTLLTPNQTRAGNALVLRSAVTTDPPFEPTFGHGGGEDVLFFGDLARRGGRVVWCDEAIVTELVPAARATTSYLLRRAYSGGATFVRTEVYRLSGRDRLRRSTSLGARALAQLPVAAVMAALTLPFSRPRGVHWLRTTAAQCGKLQAVLSARG